MQILAVRVWLLIAMLAPACAPANATVGIVSLRSSLASPQPIGATITWSAQATDSNSGPLAFQFSVAAPNGPFLMVRDFNPGTLSGTNWKSLPFAWALTGMDGIYRVRVVAKDFTSGESAAHMVSFTVSSPLTGANPVVQPTRNPLVALFTAPACPAGSSMRVFFEPHIGSAPATTTNWAACNPAATMTFEIAGMYPGTAYNLHAQVDTGGSIANGPTVGFTTGALPLGIAFPTFAAVVPASPSDPNHVVLRSLFNARTGVAYPDVATDLSGSIIWYNDPTDQGGVTMMTRPVDTGFLAIQYGPAWDPGVQVYQVLRQFDWAGNLIRETNTGILQQELLALGAVDAGPCNTVPSPPPVGAACLGIFHHDAIQTLPNGYSAVLVDIEKIFPAGTQADTSGLPVDIVGDMIVVLNRNWQAVWYWDSFDPAGGGNGYPQLPVSRTAVLGDVCPVGNRACLILFLRGSGVSPSAHDWLHANSLYYWPHDGVPAPSTLPGDIIWSSRHQDWVMKIDYKDGAGTGDILWRMGPSGDFNFENIYGDPWPWFSHQHEAGIENNGAGPFTVFENGNTRLSPPSGPGSSTGGVPGLGSNCAPNDCNSRGMSLTFDEAGLQVTPVLSANLGVYSDAMGGAQLLADGNYFFMAAIVPAKSFDSYDIEIQPASGTGTGPQVLNLSGPPGYRSWLMPNLYSPPIT